MFKIKVYTSYRSSQDKKEGEEACVRVRRGTIPLTSEDTSLHVHFMKYNKELLKGTTPMLILNILSTKDMHGYEIVKRLEETSEYTLSVAQGSLYPILHNLEEDGYLEAYWIGEDSKRKKKVYHITDSGQNKLNQLVDEWNQYSKSIFSVINRGKVYE